MLSILAHFIAQNLFHAVAARWTTVAAWSPPSREHHAGPGPQSAPLEHHRASEQAGPKIERIPPKPEAGLRTHSSLCMLASSCSDLASSGRSTAGARYKAQSSDRAHLNSWPSSRAS